MSLVPSTDQISGQLRIIIPAVGMLVTGFGVSTAAAQSWTQIGLALVGPLSIVIAGIWQLISDSRASIMKAAAKPVTKDAPAPQIVLPAVEKELADKLPDNVTAKGA